MHNTEVSPLLWVIHNVTENPVSMGWRLKTNA